MLRRFRLGDAERTAVSQGSQTGWLLCDLDWLFPCGTPSAGFRGCKNAVLTANFAHSRKYFRFIGVYTCNGSTYGIKFAGLEFSIAIYCTKP